MTPLQEILKLSVPERILMAEKIWESINTEEIQLTETQKTELDRRLERHKRGETKFSSWEEVKTRMRSK